MPNLLVEIGTEELPVDALNVIYEQLESRIQAIFAEERLSFEKISVEATPRRIAFFVTSLASRQEDWNFQIRGPSYEKAYEGGAPTAALLGFMKKNEAKLSDTKVEDIPNRGKVIVIQKAEKGKSTSSVLPAILNEIFTSLSFPKTMRWEATAFRFPRPIRWMVALLDKTLIPFQLADVKTGRQSFGHRFLAPKPFTIPRADWKEYARLLRRAHVILELEERKQLIAKALRGRFHQKSFDEELLHITAQLVEEPFLIQGTFSKTYLELPVEVLASCMKKNQKVFACYDAKHHLTGHFAAVMNGRRGGLSRIRADYENVLESRLRDAKYFYEADTREPFERKRPLLEQIVYLGKLGTLREKTERLEKLAEKFSSLIGRDDLKNSLKRTARLSKIDLMTHLVYEFPDLQGIVGREYALESGENEEVARAIGTQYLPKNLGEDYRVLTKEITPLGALFGIIDRLDLLVGAFGIGLEPSGSQDPFALRRAGGSIVKLVRAFGFHFSIGEAIEAACDFYGKALNVARPELEKKLRSFLAERVTFEIQPKPGSRAAEILNAVVRSGFDDLADVYARYETLARLYEREPDAFIKAGKVVERTANILKGIKGEVSSLNPDLLKEPLEQKLFRCLEEGSGAIQESLARRDYEQATLLYGKTFYVPLHDFFEQVLVNTEDAAIRSNRQALMKKINRLYTERLADLSVLSRLDQG